VLAAAAELDVFSALKGGPLGATQVARERGLDPRGARILLDALASLGYLTKEGDLYSVPAGVAASLGGHGSGSVLWMARHQANCLRRWALLSQVVKTGRPADRTPSVRGEDEDSASFIGAMDDISAPVADGVIAALRPVHFEHLLDVGGASGTWTAAFLRREPRARATIFDLPHVIPLAERRLAAAGILDRVRLVPGDFSSDPLPPGADLAWVSAIVHQNSRVENRRLFRSVRDALAPGGAIAVRDMVMDPSRTTPVAGALFAVNMLVGTEGGDTFTFEEMREDLESSGFREVQLVRRDPGMHSIVLARR
jgi:SAM-dependent methyltransferase